jgi:transcription antitermination factor NusG
MTENRFDPKVETWVALRTSARWEKKIATLLQSSDVPVFVPLMSRVIQYPGKRQLTEIPLFSGYVFTSESDFIGNAKVPISCRNQVAQVLRPSDPTRLSEELARIADLIQNHQLVQEKIYGQPGERVVIKSGSFAGHEGIILDLKPNKKMLVVEVSFLKCRLEVEIEEHLVEKAP